MLNLVEQALSAFMANRQNTELTDTEKAYIDVLRSGNANAGEQLALKICQNMGVPKDQAILQASQYLARRGFGC